MKKQIAVIGLGRFGASLAITLVNMGHDVLAIDKDEKRVQDIASQITHAVQADATNDTILKELDIGNFDIAIVSMGSAIESSVLSTILLKKLEVPYVIARANSDLHGSILEKIGADTVVYPEREMGTELAQVVTLSGVSDYMSIVQGYGVSKLKVPQYLVNKTLSDLGFGPKNRFEVAVLLIQREKEVIVTPGQGESIKPGDVLIMAGRDDNIEKLLTEAQKSKPEEKAKPAADEKTGEEKRGK
jgi:trk system potassium uptake protein TrkA